jgi:hypothetical protein
MAMFWCVRAVIHVSFIVELDTARCMSGFTWTSSRLIVHMASDKYRTAFSRLATIRFAPDTPGRFIFLPPWSRIQGSKEDRVTPRKRE